MYIINVNLYTTIFYCNMLENTRNAPKTVSTKNSYQTMIITFPCFVLAHQEQKDKMAEVKPSIRRRGEERTAAGDGLLCR